MNDFYVGYLPKASDELAKFVRRVVAGMGLLALALALILVLAPHPFANSTFEFGKPRSFEGVIAEQPYPQLSVVRPGASSQQDGYSRYLLVAPGKHSADSLVAGFDGEAVHLQGQLIYREGGTMLEVVPGSIVARDGPSDKPEVTRDLGPVTVTGEIVDSKCYLGVMNPGNGKVHRDCAARCLSGGIPPLFVSSDRGDQYLLVGAGGEALHPDALRGFIAEPLTVQGTLLQRGESRLLEIGPRTLRHAAGNSR